MIVISNDAYNQASEDIVVAAMTSNPTQRLCSFTISSADLLACSLNRPGTVRIDKIYTLASTIVVKRFAKVTPAVLGKGRAHLELLTKP